MSDLDPYFRATPTVRRRRPSPPQLSPPAVVAAMRQLVETTSLPYPAVGARVGVCAGTVWRWQRREGWVRPAPGEETRPDPSVPTVARPTNPRFKRGRGRRYVPDVVERVRVLVEGTALSQAAIAAKTGLGVTTVSNWTRRGNWTRPLEAARWKCLVRLDRAGLGPRLRSGFGRVEALTRRELGRVAGAANPDTGATERVRRLAEAARRQAGHFDRPAEVPPWIRSARAGGDGVVRLSGQPRGKRGGNGRGPWDEEAVAAAQRLVERTTLRQTEIARQIGIHPSTLSAWRQAGGWARPPGAPCRHGGPGRSALMAERRRDREEACWQLAEAERLLALLEREERAETDAIERHSGCWGLRAWLFGRCPPR